MSLKDKLLKIDDLTESLENTDIFSKKDLVNIGIPVIDIALSGDIDGGLSSGMTMISAPSKHFKTMLGLMMVRAYMNKYPDSLCLFYDSEYGTPKSYWENFNIDSDRVVHVTVKTLESMRTHITRSLDEMEKDEKVIIFIDSFGNIPSKKEVEDAKTGNEAVDMTRAKVIKSITRIACIEANHKNIPIVGIGHVYQTMELYSKPVMSGGTGITYNSDNILFIGRRQNKKNGELLGYEFVLNVEKSRYTKEATQLPFKVSYDEGIFKYSGLLSIALEHGSVTKPKVGWYTRPFIENDKNYREKEIEQSDDFWKPIFEETDFKEFVKEKFQIGKTKF